MKNTVVKPAERHLFRPAEQPHKTRRTKAMQLLFTPDEHQVLKNIAADNHMTVSDVIRAFIRKGILPERKETECHPL